MQSSLSTTELLKEARDLAHWTRDKFDGSSLGAIGEQLEELLLGVVAAVENGHPNRQLRDAIASVQNICRGLPTSFGPRFSFDISLIDAIRQEWQVNGARFFHTPVPRYKDAGWATARIVMPAQKGLWAHSVRVITFPGTDRLSDVDLRDYPWLFHEMAHDLFYQDQHRFQEHFGSALDSRIRSLKLRAVSDRGAMERLSSSHISQLDSYWRPRADQHDWAHEIASDVAAARAIGPPFLSCIAELLRKNPDRSFNAADQHPPFLTRAEALVLAATQLQWPNEAWVLEEQIASTKAASSANRGFLVFGDTLLLQEVVDAALQACDALGVPTMTQRAYSGIAHLNEIQAANLDGTALIAAASIWAHRLSRDRYRTWVEGVVRG